VFNIQTKYRNNKNFKTLAGSIYKQLKQGKIKKAERIGGNQKHSGEASEH